MRYFTLFYFMFAFDTFTPQYLLVMRFPLLEMPVMQNVTLKNLFCQLTNSIFFTSILWNFPEFLVDFCILPCWRQFIIDHSGSYNPPLSETHAHLCVGLCWPPFRTSSDNVNDSHWDIRWRVTESTRPGLADDGGVCRQGVGGWGECVCLCVCMRVCWGRGGQGWWCTGTVLVMCREGCTIAQPDGNLLHLRQGLTPWISLHSDHSGWPGWWEGVCACICVWGGKHKKGASERRKQRNYMEIICNECSLRHGTCFSCFHS